MLKYQDIHDGMILNYEFLKIAIFEETKVLFEDRPYILDKWEKEAYRMTDDEVKEQVPDYTMGPSFRALFSLFTQTLYFEKLITKEMIKNAMNTYKDTIKVILAGHFIHEFPMDEIKRSVNEEKVSEALNRQYIYSSMDMDYHLMRDIVTKKKDFKKGEAGLLATEIIDNRGKVRGLAEIRPPESQTTELASDQQEMWLELIESTINSLDEMTADLFDLITYLWMVSPKTSDGYIEFHSNDALQLRNLKKRTAQGRELDFREEDRFNIMKRVAALSSIWVSLGNQQVKVVNAQDIQDNELYEFKDFQRMFEVGKIRVAYDKKSGEPKGIYAVQVKPSSVLTPYLDGPNRTLGLLDLKVFQYSHYTQREHKRLTRYLNLQWKIRTIRRSLQQPFKVSTLLKVMDISNRYNGVQKRDKFENVLDELQRDSVISSWSYTEEIDEEQVGKKGWFHAYWTKSSVLILPTDIVVKENQKKMMINANNLVNEEIIERMNQISHENSVAEDILFSKKDYSLSELAPTLELGSIEVPSTLLSGKFVNETHMKTEQQSFHFEPETDIALSPETMKEAMDSQKMSIRQTAEEIGISHSTLSRYLRRENKRQNNKNDEKMLNWIKEKSKRQNSN
ncbi:helix-turn-helix domain-containing protein [Peribacillus frigoritolerans]|uniref:helix-turn-helix domain-containing protein n=1 Tax=Peribacillus frigoritolerans TaxID=450367 RepID=UPI0020410993|nr:helix-turn-helix domain-containing protein [Peribacillus frigoritolerans]MCM3169529.1 helix-turn-helix domain-containing protein [Peribacillus frigoritolerans]